MIGLGQCDVEGASVEKGWDGTIPSSWECRAGHCDAEDVAAAYI